MKIPIAKTHFTEADLAIIQEPLKNGWVVQGPFTKRFEDAVAGYTKSPHAIATSSCTTALHIAVAALGLKPGDEVIVPAFTWVSTANVVEYMGAKPVFCDVELGTFNIDPRHLESLVTPRTVGIIPVHLFGLCADMDAVMKFAAKHNLWVVEDAACAFGSWQGGKHAGTFGDAGCFSFHPRKSITTGEGGMIITARDDLATLSRSLRDHGASRTDHERHHAKAGFLLAEYNHLGYNYRMTDIQGALGCTQMERADWILGGRSRFAKRYDEMLAGLDWLVTPKVPAGDVHGYQAYVCLFRPEEPSLANVEKLNERRNTLMTRLDEVGIATRQGTHAPVTLGYYAKKYSLRPEMFPNAHMADLLTLALPLYPQMTEAEHDYVVQELKRIYGET